MHDIARTSPENGMELILTTEREAGVATILVAREAISKIPAPRALTDISCECSDVPDLRCCDGFRSFRQNCVPCPNEIMPAQGVQGDEATDVHTVICRLHLIETLYRFQIHKDIWPDDALFNEREQVASSSDECGCVPLLACLLGQRHRMLQITSIGIGKRFHASAPKILSRVIGRSFMR